MNFEPISILFLASIKISVVLGRHTFILKSKRFGLDESRSKGDTLCLPSILYFYSNEFL